MTFKNLESLKYYLKKDSEQFSINPVRFINVDSMIMWIEVKKLLLSMADESLPLSKFCEDKDTTPNINRINSVLRKATNSKFVTPLSEYLRMKPEIAAETIRKFIKADYQNNDSGKLRIYFLMYRMKNLLKTMPSDDPRQKDCIILLETNEESDYRLTIIQKDLNVKLPGNEIEGFKSYLEYWEANPDKPLILYTANAIHFEKNHFFDNVHVIVSSYDLIRYQYSLPSNMTENLGSSENWNELIKVIVKEGSLERACCFVLSINRYSTNLFVNWNRYTEFQKWIIWLWTRLQLEKSYVVECAKSCDSSEQFSDALYCHIIRELHSESFISIYEERKSVLASMQTVPSELFWEKISKLTLYDSLSCLTCLTDVERKTIFEIIAGIEFKNRFDVLKKLKIVYPQLYYYLHNDEQPNKANLISFHEDYFEEYKWLKATDTITGTFIEKVKSIAFKKGLSVFALQSRNHYVTINYDDNTTIMFVDGMGIEYVDYLSHLFCDLDGMQYSCTFEAGFCNLPSVTEINKDFMNNRNTIEPPIRELDELKHSHNIHPESIIKQFQILDSIKDRILALLVGNIHKIIITSDHGTSRLAVKVRNTEFDNIVQKPEGVNIYKYGRFCEESTDESIYPTAINYNNRLVFADYTRFIQNGAPIDEIHGGASLEEWLVPVITIEKLTKEMSEKVIITPTAEKYRVELGTKQVKVRFTITGTKRETVAVSVKGIRISCIVENEEYCFSYIPTKDDAKITVKVIDGGILGQFDIYIEQGIGKNAKFDI